MVYESVKIDSFEDDCPHCNKSVNMNVFVDTYTDDSLGIGREISVEYIDVSCEECGNVIDDLSEIARDFYSEWYYILSD